MKFDLDQIKLMDLVDFGIAHTEAINRNMKFDDCREKHSHVLQGKNSSLRFRSCDKQAKNNKPQLICIWENNKSCQKDSVPDNFAHCDSQKHCY